MTRFISLIITLLTISICASGKEFVRLSTDEGLSNNAVLCMYQDEYGMIWAGTRNGLNRYTGNGFDIFKYRKGDDDCLQYNYVKDLAGDGNGKIYAIAFGITEYDLKTGTFRSLTEAETGAICWNGALYAGIGRTLVKYDGSRFEEICKVPAEAVQITAIGVHDDYILIGTEANGLYKYNHGSVPVNIVRQSMISSIFHDKNGRWWIGTWHDGMYVIDRDGIRNIRRNPSDKNTLSSDFVRCFCQDADGDIWIGTFNGIDIYDPATGDFSYYSDSEGSAGYSSIWSLMCDRQGNIWAGTYFDGIYLSPAGDKMFRHWSRASDSTEGLSSNMIREFAEDRDGNLWIATDGGGLDRIDSSRKHFKWYRHADSQNSISHNNVTALYYDPAENILWVGTHLGGLNRLDLRTGTFSNYRYDPENASSLISDVIKDISHVGKDLVVITDKGVCLFDPATGKAERLKAEGAENIIDAMGCTVDSSGIVWIYGVPNGAYAWDSATGELKNYRNDPDEPNSICSNSVNCVYQDGKGRLWFCSNLNGIDLYRPGTDDFVNLDEAGNGIASNRVYNVSELPSGRLIFTTDVGFSILEDSTFTFTNYDRGNGIPLTSINEKALYITSEDEIFVGTNNGMIAFSEENLGTVPPGYAIVPFRLTVHGQTIHAGGEDGILEKPLSETDRLVLKSSQSIFSIEYVTSDYVSDDEKNLEYYMDGLSQKWTSMEGKPVVTFSHLDKGKYTLTVRPGNSMSSEYSRSLEIIVLPPVWQSWWAILLYIFFGSGILYFIIRNYKNHVHLKEALKYEKSRAEDIETLNKSKIRFFTNISHEFRSPLTLISGNTEMLLAMKNISPEIYNKILSIYRSSSQMQDLITELLDFSKLENGHMQIRAGEHNLVKFAYETFLLFKEYANTRKIDFDFVKTEDNIRIWFDPKQMQKVLNNLISNAFKHTKDGGRISVVVRRDGPEAVVEVNDNGSGIPAQDIDRIFDRFYQSEYQQSDTYTGTGIGLSLCKGIVELHHGRIEVYSRPDEGASFKVFLPTGNSHFSEEQLRSETGPDIAMTELPELKAGEYAERPEARENKSDGMSAGEKKYTMLIAEDNDGLRKMLTDIFSPFYTVLAAPDGKQAWEITVQSLPDIVVSDIVMPEMSGTDLCRMIKTDLTTCHIPVVMLTARTTVQQNLEGLYAGADDYISKPFNLDILLARCNNLVNNRAMLREKFSSEVQTTPQMLATNPLDKKLIEQVTKVIEDHIDDTGMNPDMLTSEIGISRTKLFSKLKSITGLTPADFILTFRLKKAAVLLRENPELNISEIADRLGFSSPRQFSRFFKEKYGIIPQAYRKGGTASTPPHSAV